MPLCLVYALRVPMLTLYCIAGGLYMPEANAVALLRRDIDRRPQRIKATLKDEGIRREFLDGALDNDAQVVKKFVAQSSQSALKTKPKVSSIFLSRLCHEYAFKLPSCTTF